jgi:hypothetical protein
MAVMSTHFDGDPEVRAQLVGEGLRLAALNPDFLGAERVDEETGFALSVSYWKTREAFNTWSEEAFAWARKEFNRPEGSTMFSQRVVRIARVDEVRCMSTD